MLWSSPGHQPSKLGIYAIFYLLVFSVRDISCLKLIGLEMTLNPRNVFFLATDASGSEVLFFFWCLSFTHPAHPTILSLQFYKRKILDHSHMYNNHFSVVKVDLFLSHGSPKRMSALIRDVSCLHLWLIGRTGVQSVLRNSLNPGSLYVNSPTPAAGGTPWISNSLSLPCFHLGRMV